MPQILRNEVLSNLVSDEAREIKNSEKLWSVLEPSLRRLPGRGDLVRTSHGPKSKLGLYRLIKEVIK
jgi:hypothetical protein